MAARIGRYVAEAAISSFLDMDTPEVVCFGAGPYRSNVLFLFREFLFYYGAIRHRRFK